jgi:hypothetical protein
MGMSGQLSDAQYIKVARLSVRLTSRAQTVSDRQRVAKRKQAI